MCDVKHHNGRRRAAVIHGRKAVVPLLASRVPEAVVRAAHQGSAALVDAAQHAVPPGCRAAPGQPLWHRRASSSEPVSSTKAWPWLQKSRLPAADHRMRASPEPHAEGAVCGGSVLLLQTRQDPLTRSQT